MKLNFIITITVIVIIGLLCFVLKSKDYTPYVLKCDTLITNILNEHGVNTDNPQNEKKENIRAFKIRGIYVEKQFLIPQTKNSKLILEQIARANISPLKIGKIQKKSTKKELITIVDFYAKNLKLYRLILKQKLVKARIAIVLDDWGYSNKLLKTALNLNIPITYALLPSLPYTLNISKTLQKTNHEVILHLPLEPHNASEHPIEKNTILTTMPEEEITHILKEHLKSVSHIKGVNNHMGSKATENIQTMNIIFDQLNKSHLYFLDSQTSKNSVGQNIAREKDVLFLKRDVFLDDEYNKKSIKKQMEKVKNISADKGYAIAIGHAKPATLEILKEMIPQFQKQGYEFVYVSELLDNKK